MNKGRRSIFIILCALSAQGFCGINVSEDLIHEYTLEIGKKVSGQITVTNMGKDETMVKLEICDYSTDHSGKVAFDPPNSHVRSLSSWIALGGSSVVLSPGEQRVIPYEVLFNPSEDKVMQTGSYWSAVLISPEPLYKPTEQGMGIATIVRYAVIISGGYQMEDAEASIRIPDHGIEETLDDRFGWFYLENDGALIIKSKIMLELINAEGDVVYTSPPSGEGVLFPSSSTRIRFNLTKAPEGTFTGLLTIDAGEDRVFGAQYAMTIEKFSPYSLKEQLDADEQVMEGAEEVETLEVSEQVRVNYESSLGEEIVALCKEMDKDIENLLKSVSDEYFWDNMVVALEHEIFQFRYGLS